MKEPWFLLRGRGLFITLLGARWDCKLEGGSGLQPGGPEALAPESFDGRRNTCFVMFVRYFSFRGN